MPITVALQSLREEIDHKEDAVEFLKRRKFEEEFKYEELPVELKEKIIELGLDGRISQKTKMRNLIDFIDSTKNSEMNTMTRIATKAMELKTVSLPIICVNLEIVDSRRYEELWNKVMKGYFNKCMFKAEKIITFTRMLSSLKQFWV